VGSVDSIVRLWSTQTGQLVERLVGHNGGVHSMAFTPDGKNLVSGGQDQTVKNWDLRSLLKDVQREAPLRQSYEVDGEDASSVVNEHTGQNEDMSVCAVEFMGHKVRGRSPHLCVLS
jgi:WD40 repeat protein